MADSSKYYVVKGDKQLVESMTKEQILAAITEAIEEGEISDVDTGFVTTIKETNKNKALKFWIGTQAEYNAIETPEKNVFYIISDDTTQADLEEAIAELQEDLDNQIGDLSNLNFGGGNVVEGINNIATVGAWSDLTSRAGGAIKLGNVLIRWGTVVFYETSGADSYSLNFTAGWKYPPAVCVTPRTSAPNAVFASATDVTTTRFVIHNYRSSSTPTDQTVNWIAIGLAE